MSGTNRSIESQIKEATNFVLTRVTIPTYVEMDDLKQEIAMSVLRNQTLEQERINRIAENDITEWVTVQKTNRSITEASMEAVADYLGYEMTSEQISRLSRRGAELLLSKLPQKQKRVVCMLYGVNSPRIYTVPEVAAVLHVTCDDVSECRTVALEQLKRLADASTIADFLVGVI